MQFQAASEYVSLQMQSQYMEQKAVKRKPSGMFSPLLQGVSVPFYRVLFSRISKTLLQQKLLWCPSTGHLK
jgi:hypothetical protein